jgi:hypothetical protein
MKELSIVGREAHRHAAKESTNAIVKWMAKAKDAVANKLIWLGTEMKAVVFTSAWATGAVGVAAGVGLVIGARNFRKWNKERLHSKYAGGGHSSGGH